MLSMPESSFIVAILGYKQSEVFDVVGQDPGQQEREEPHHPVLLEQIDGLDGVLFRLQEPHHVYVHYQERYGSVGCDGHQPCQA